MTANLQTVYSLLKSHNPTLCSTCSKKSCDRNCEGPQKSNAVSKPEATSQSQQETAFKKKVARPPLPKPAEKVQSATSSDVLESSLTALEKEFRDLRQ